MAGRQLVSRLLQHASRSVNSGTTTPGSHRLASCTSVWRNVVPSDNAVGFASSSSPAGSRNVSSCSVFPSTASFLISRVRDEFLMASRQSGNASAGLPHMQQQRTMVTKLKKTKIKAYSSYKKRFRGLATGEFKRWRSGKQHNAHSKTNKQKRQLRRPSVAPAALATVMKKLNFLG